MPRRKAGATQPRSLVVLKDGHVGSEWFAEAMQRQPATRFIFEMGPCITGSLPGKLAFVTEKRGCACSKEDCQLFKRDIQQAPCLDSPHARACNVLGGSHMSVAADSEVVQWQQALTNATGVTIVVQTRSNLVKWAWSFLRTGASHRFLRWDTLVHFPPGDEFASADEVKRGLLAQYRQPMRWRGAVLIEPRRTSAA